MAQAERGTAYVTQTPIRASDEEGKTLYYKPGDEVPTTLFTEEQLLEMRADGRLIPKEVWAGLDKAAKAQATLETKKAEADAELQRLLLSPTHVANYEATAAHQEFTERSKRENAAIEAEQGGATLDPATGQVAPEHPHPVVTGSSPSLAAGSSQMTNVQQAQRAHATVAEAQATQKRNVK